MNPRDQLMEARGIYASVDGVPPKVLFVSPEFDRQLCRYFQEINHVDIPTTQGRLVCGMDSHVVPTLTSGFCVSALPIVHAKEISHEAHMARLRPDNFESLSAEEQWEIDKELGILDWDGT